MNKLFASLPLLFLLVSLVSAQPTLTSRIVQQSDALADALAVEFTNNKQLAGLVSGAGVEVRLPGGEFASLKFNQQTKRGKIVELGGTSVNGLNFRLQLQQLAPNLIARLRDLWGGYSTALWMGCALAAVGALAIALLPGPSKRGPRSG